MFQHVKQLLAEAFTSIRLSALLGMPFISKEGVGDRVDPSSCSSGVLDEGSLQAHTESFHASPGPGVQLVRATDYLVQTHLLECEGKDCSSDLHSITLPLSIRMKDHPDLALAGIGRGEPQQHITDQLPGRLRFNTEVAAITWRLETESR